MRTNKNTEQIAGRIYSHDLSIRKVENKNSENYGKEFINGTLDVATDDAGMNVIQVHYSYVTPTTKQGKGNVSYNALKQIIDSGKTIMNDGLDQATCVRLTPSIALNDFYPQGGDELVTTPRHEGGFVTILRGPAELPPEAERNKFECDALIMICPNYNDALNAHLTAFINRLTALFRVHEFRQKRIYAIVVSGYSGGDIVSEQIIGALNFNKGFVLPGRFAMVETANDPFSILDVPDIDVRAKAFAGRI